MNKKTAAKSAAVSRPYIFLVKSQATNAFATSTAEAASAA